MISAAIATWTIAWSQIRDEFRARLHGLKIEPWWEHARLLRVMGCSHAYAWNIQQTYNQRRGTNLLLSPLDWLLVEHLACYDYPLCAIERGIDSIFDKRDRAPEFRQINSLYFCYQQIINEARLMKEAAVGSSYYLSRGSMGEIIAPPHQHTLLLALPPAGRITFSAMQSERQVDRVAEIFNVGIVFTVYPDAWQKSQALERFNVGLDFLDDAPCNGAPCNGCPDSTLSGSRPAGPSRCGGAGSSRPFLKNQNPHQGERREANG
jgi:hypothetical protein